MSQADTLGDLQVVQAQHLDITLRLGVAGQGGTHPGLPRGPALGREQIQDALVQLLGGDLLGRCVQKVEDDRLVQYEPG
jgi:hypothetical protein